MGKIQSKKNHDVYSLLSKYIHTDVRQRESDKCVKMLTTGEESWGHGVWKLYYFSFSTSLIY